MEPNNKTHYHSDIRHDVVIKALEECVSACETCIAKCIEEDNILFYSLSIKCARDCASICAQATQLLNRDSDITRTLLLVCADVCRLTAIECGNYYNAHCQICATYCKAAEKACYALHEDSL